MSAGLGKLVFDIIEAVESYGLGIQVMVGLFALGFVSTLVVRKKQARDRSD